MTDQASDFPVSSPSERFPVWNLLRGFRIAVHIAQVFLASIAVLVLALGQHGIDRLPFAPESTRTNWPWEVEQPVTGASLQDVDAMWNSGWRLLTLPFRSVSDPAMQLLRPNNSLTTAAYAWTHLLWAFVVWGYFGGAISRMAAVTFATDRGVGLKTASRYAGGRFLSFLSAPLLPIAGLLALWLALTVGGLIGRIPTVGPYIVGIFWFVALAIGLVAALIVIGLFVGWPLMSPTIATEDSDAFDGFSRSFSYVFSRPRQTVCYLLSAVIYGVICVAMVVLLSQLVAYITAWGVSSGMGMPETSLLTTGVEPPAPETDGKAHQAFLESIPGGARSITSGWLNALTVVVQGVAVSLFWTLSTIVYFLLRHVDDATSMDEVFLTEADAEDDLLPLVGVADSDQPVIERPLNPDSQSQDGEESPDADAPTT